MPCFRPVPAYQDAGSFVGPDRVWKPGRVLLSPPLGTATMCVPCGSCIGCLQDRAVDWSRRCMHEASSFAHNCFVTLTYSDKALPVSSGVPTLDSIEFSLFVKRLRKRLSSPVRFFACGEYGGLTQRPHYHCLFFNLELSGPPCGSEVFTSALLDSVWPHGHNQFGELTPARCLYVAKYAVKAVERRGCDRDGVVRERPFVRMSRRPGIGAGWLDKFKSDIQHGYLVVDGVRCRIPRGYRKRLLDGDPVLAERISFLVSKKHRPLEPDRLRDGEIIALQLHERSSKQLVSNSF